MDVKKFEKDKNVFLEFVKFLQRNIKEENIVVMYSGGADSTYLLNAVRKAFKDNKATKVTAFHVNHGLSFQNHYHEDFCKRCCDGGCIPFASVKLDLNLPKGASVEYEASKARYNAVYDYAETLSGNVCILTGHHQDDQLESFYLALSRGCGVNTITGIDESRLVSTKFRLPYMCPDYVSYVRLFRPLLRIKKDHIDRFTDMLLNHVVDETNRDEKFYRNKIRHKLLPLLKSMFSETCSGAIGLMEDASLNAFERTEKRWHSPIERLYRVRLLVKKCEDVLNEHGHKLSANQASELFKQIERKMELSDNSNIPIKIQLSKELTLVLKLKYNRVKNFVYFKLNDEKSVVFELLK